MKVFGLTGGIGSGKSTVAKLFELLKVPVYYSDERAKLIYYKPEIKQEVIRLLGAESYVTPEQINKKHISEKIFGDKSLLEKINQLIHPAVESDFNEWLKCQDAEYVLKEAAILFETGIYKKLDGTLLVISPKDLKIKRILKRDKSDLTEVEKRINAQLPDEEKMKYADWIIYNDESHSLISQCVNFRPSLRPIK